VRTKEQTTSYSHTHANTHTHTHTHVHRLRAITQVVDTCTRTRAIRELVSGLTSALSTWLEPSKRLVLNRSTKASRARNEFAYGYVESLYCTHVCLFIYYVVFFSYCVFRLVCVSIGCWMRDEAHHSCTWLWLIVIDGPLQHVCNGDEQDTLCIWLWLQHLCKMYGFQLVLNVCGMYA
jgi:hypothetical protein